MIDEKKKCLWVQARYKDFDGDLEKWKNSFYEIWRYQLTWNFAWKIELFERVDGVLVNMYVKPAFKDNIITTMNALGYQDISVENVRIGIVYEYDHDELDDIDYLTMD